MDTLLTLRRPASFHGDVCIGFGVCSVVTSPPTSWQRSCWHDWTTATLCSARPSHYKTVQGHPGSKFL